MDQTPKQQNIRERMSLGTLRKSLGGKDSGSAALLTPLDDEKERRVRRSVIETQRRLTFASSTTSPKTPLSLSINEEQVKEHLKICVKLFVENRISVKNAWEIHVIDTMRKITSLNSSNVLQVAGSSLDIGAKVYGIRVDDVHAKGLQLASSMAANKDKGSSQDNDDANGEEVLTGNKERRKRKIKKLARDKRNVIDKEKKNTFAPIQVVESAVFSTKENIDMSATDNLFTQKLPTDPGSHQFMLMSAVKYWYLPPDERLEGAGEALKIELPDNINVSLCEAFKTFDIGAWSLEDEERLLPAAVTVPDVILDDAGIPIAELDGSIHDIFQDIGNDPVSEEEERQEEFHAQINGEINNIVDAVPEEYRIQTDYGYNVLVRTSTGKYIDKIWAGPSHWKVKFNRRSMARFSGLARPLEKHIKKAKEYAPIDLSDVEVKMPENLEKWKSKRAPPTTTFDKITLPIPEIDLSMECFERSWMEFHMKPGTKRRIKINNNNNNYTNIVNNVEIQESHNDDGNDYCPMNIDADGADHSFEEDVAAAAEGQFLDENLINAPDIVNANHVTYALQAKKTDMKKLKTVIWTCLREKNDSSNVNPTQFSQLYDILARILPADMKKELSCPMAMVALLHLCNEKNLLLKGQSDLKDFLITSAVS